MTYLSILLGRGLLMHEEATGTAVAWQVLEVAMRCAVRHEHLGHRRSWSPETLTLLPPGAPDVALYCPASPSVDDLGMYSPGPGVMRGQAPLLGVRGSLRRSLTMA